MFNSQKVDGVSGRYHRIGGMALTKILQRRLLILKAEKFRPLKETFETWSFIGDYSNYRPNSIFIS